MSSPSENATDALTGIVDDARAKAVEAAESIATAAHDVTGQIKVSATELSSQANSALSDPQGLVRRQLRENPAAVVAVAALASFVLGALVARNLRS